MASYLVKSLNPHFKRGVELLPPYLAVHARNAAGEVQDLSTSSLIVALLVGWLVFAVFRTVFGGGKKRNYPPRVPGLPLLGNLLQLGEKKPHRTFTKWIKNYGPIFSIRTGTVDHVVISSGELAKEAMVTKYAQISSRQMPAALQILTKEKTMVAMSDYGDQYRTLKKNMVGHLLGPVPQKVNRPIRERCVDGMIDDLTRQVLSASGKKTKVDVRETIKRGLFPFAMTQVFGRDPDSVYVPELSRTLDRWELYERLVIDPLKAAIDVDWRDFFPAMKKYFSNNSVIDGAKSIDATKTAIIRALIAEQRKLLAQKKAPDCFLDSVLTYSTSLTNAQLEQLTWEPVIESSDTVLVTTEWVMYELAIHPHIQERVYQEIKTVVGDKMVTEEDLPKLVYLNACIKETLRKYPPVPIIPSRTVEEDIQLGGYDIPKGWQIILNLYGISNDPERWPEPEKWDPERVLHDEKLDMGFKDYRMLPFGAGKRMCAGVQQAMYQVPAFLAAYIQHFSWELAPEEDPTKLVEATAYLTTHKLHPLQAIATARPGITKRLPRAQA